MALDKDLPLGLECHPKQQSSPRGGETGAKLVTADAPEKSLEQTLQDENSRMLLDIDINSHFTPPVGEEITDDEGGNRTLDSPRQGTRPEANMIKAVSEKLAARQGRLLLPLPSIGVPTQRKAKDKLHHCMNSIPHNLDLGVAMEPVDVVSVSPTPTGTPAEDVTAQGSQLNILDRRSMDVTLAASELDSPNDDQWPVRTHMTSALRYAELFFKLELTNQQSKISQAAQGDGDGGVEDNTLHVNVTSQLAYCLVSNQGGPGISRFIMG